ncbi:hypothetical protein RBWH47_05476 [Rhodopirellula baltica WH47]|uniref:Uncharacterized protein n=1 Tax=Rhodopirellula baltica WH47 TaxID=991778 RepID=F2B2D1_RHOBT|nr:hypothetical protein RBWH47_05476 [Rhodopirellula baltica WH47]
MEQSKWTDRSAGQAISQGKVEQFASVFEIGFKLLDLPANFSQVT